jgi:hypothetical protein
MEHCIAACDRFEVCTDPYNNGRTCFKVTHGLLERSNMIAILKDEKFLFIKDMIVYFK